MENSSERYQCGIVRAHVVIPNHPKARTFCDVEAIFEDGIKAAINVIHVSPCFTLAPDLNMVCIEDDCAKITKPLPGLGHFQGPASYQIYSTPRRKDF